MEIYEKTHGGSGEDGGKSSHFFVERFAVTSGIDNCSFLDFLPVPKVEEEEIMGGLSGASLAVEETKNEEMWCGPMNGTESRTTARDEMCLRKLLLVDVLESLELHDESVPLSSPGWLVSYLALTFLSSNVCSSSAIGSGTNDLMHPICGLKCELLSQTLISWAGLQNCIRVMSTCFMSTMLIDVGETNLVLPDMSFFHAVSESGNTCRNCRCRH
jgi:hypothetical protein